ncbi:MAG TPA: 6-phosphogluconolactonase [Solirubrobacteraceae bacterium]|nr:6-phosphogluconolactonase [Solirubrobacteraceae bacterium]
MHELARSAAELILDDCTKTLEARSGAYTLGLSGGRTPRLMFQALAELPMPWDRVHIFQVDERVAPSGHDDRNFTHLSDCLLAGIEIPSRNVHPMPVEGDNPASACRSYERELQNITDGAPLDILQLGLGDDGHTASLPPGDAILNVADRAVWWVEEFNGLPRMSMTYALINDAQRILWLASGSTKAEMCSRLLASDHTIPAGRVAHKRAVLLVDNDAAAEL